MAKRATLTDGEFVSKCQRVKREGGGLDELAALTGLKRSTVLARRSALRGKGWVIEEFARGSKGGSTVDHTPTEADFQQMAEAMGLTVDEVKAKSAEVKATVQKRAEAIAKGRAEANA